MNKLYFLITCILWTLIPSLQAENRAFAPPTAVVTDATCGQSNGAINLTPDGVNPPYTFNWSSGQMTEDLSGIPAGSYTVTVTDVSGNTETLTVDVANIVNPPGLTALPNPATCGQNSGSINLIVAGGIGPFVYIWSNGAGTEDLTLLPPGDYTVTVTGSNGCTATEVATVGNNNTAINITGVITPNTTCLGSGNGAIDVSVSPGGNYTYTWSNGAGTQDLTNLAPGPYDLTVTTGLTCSSMITFIVPNNATSPGVSFIGIVSATCGASNGAIQFLTSGGTPPYTYGWSTGATTPGLINIPSGPYSVTITGSNGCTGTGSFTVLNDNPPYHIDGIITHNTACTGGNGAINVTVTPAGSFTYTWSNGATSQDLTNLVPGTYNLTVTFGPACSGTEQFIINDNSNPPNISFIGIVPSHCGASDGAIQFLTSGGVPPFTYLWSNGTTLPGNIGIPGGDYTVTVTGSNGCTATQTFTVPNDNPPYHVDNVISPNTFCIGSNGAINLTVTPGGVYLYAWSNGAITQDLTGVPAGNYTVTITYGPACGEVINFTVPDQPGVPNITFIGLAATTCHLPNGGIQFLTIGGTAPYTYHWSNGASTSGLIGILSGDYSVTITGADGCSSVHEFTLPNDDPPITATATAVSNTTCIGGNGSLDLTAIPASPYYSYLWSNGATTADLTNLPNGSYTVTITLEGTCNGVATFDVYHNPQVPPLLITPNAASCGLSNGSINVSALNGGVPPYTYIWSTGQITQFITGIPAGDYFVTVTGANGCTTVGGGTVNDNVTNFSASGIITDLTSCITNNGKIVLFLSPASLSVLWANGSTATIQSNLAAGDYTVTVSAGGTCTETLTLTVNNLVEYPSLPSTVFPASCNLANGAIDLTVNGGQAPFTYIWSNGASVQDLDDLPAGTYQVTVTSSLGCSAETMAVVPNNNIPIQVQGIVAANTSCAAPNGSVNLDILPADTYDYAWSNGQGTANLANLGAGTYIVTVSQGGSCTASATFVVTSSTINPLLASNIAPSICGVSNGSIDLSVSGAAAPYTFTWSNGAITEDLTGLASGNYTVTVSATNGCSATATLNVPNSSGTFNLAGAAAALTNCTANNGAIDLTITPAGSFTILWSNGAISEDLSGLAAGTYTVSVTQSGSCTASTSFFVTDQRTVPLLSQSVLPELCGQINGSIDLEVTGGTGPYGYQWTGGGISQDLPALAAGAYTVTVTDANGCSATATATVPANSIAFSVTGTTTASSSCLQSNGAINLILNPAAPPSGPGYTYAWSNSATTPSLTGLAAGNYQVTVSAGGTCTTTASFPVVGNAPVPAISPTVGAAFCGQAIGDIDLTVSASVAPYTYLWSTGAVSEDLTGLAAGNYTVTVSSANGCTAVDNYTIPDNSFVPGLTGTTVPSTSCTASTGSLDLTVNPAVPVTGASYTFTWSNGAVIPDLTGISAGIYQVTVSAGGTCTSTASFTVGSNTPVPSLTSSILPASCGQTNGSLDVTVNTGVAPFTYLWSNGAVSEDLTALGSGEYLVTISSSNACTVVETLTVPDNTVVPAIDGLSTPATSCTVNNGSIDLIVSPSLAYTFLWSNGSVSQNLTGLAPGSYGVTVNGGGACTNEAIIVVSSDAPLPLLTGTVQTEACSQPTGAIDLGVTNGVGPYTFMWSNGALNEDLTSLVAGDYMVTVTAANSCTVTETYTVSSSGTVPAVNAVLTPATSCVSNNGAIDLNVTTGIGPYIFLWSNGSAAEDLLNVLAGNYTVTVSGSGGCTATATYSLGSNLGTVLLNGLASNILCFDGNNGSIDLTVNGGTAPYTYNWSPALPGNPQDPADLDAGTYTVTVTDINGCTNTAVFSVLQPAASLQLGCSAVNPASMPGTPDGAGLVTLIGGTGPYTVNWSPGSVQTGLPAGDFSIPNLSSGNYAISVTDANGCPAACDFTVGLANCATATGSMAGSLLTACGGDCLTATYNTNGQVLDSDDGLQFVLHTGSGNLIINEIARSGQPVFCFDPATMAFGTTYYISAVVGNADGNGNVLLNDPCTAVSDGTPIRFTEKPLASALAPAALNCLDTQVDIEGNASLPGALFAWSTASGMIIGTNSLSVVTATAAGAYTLIVSLNGCADTTMVVVADLTNSPQATILAPAGTGLDCLLKEVVLNGQVGGTQAAQTAWMSNGQTLTGSTTLTVSTPGFYQFMLVDTQTHCVDTAFISIDQDIASPTLLLSPPGQLTCTTSNLTLSGSSLLPGIALTWATIAGADTTLLATGAILGITLPGTYYLFAADPGNHCQNAASVTVSADLNPPIANAGQPFSLGCLGDVAALDGSGSSGALGLGYTWTSLDGQFVSGAGTATPQIDAPGTYVLLVTNPGNGCTATDEVTILSSAPVAFASVEQPVCPDDHGLIRIDSVSGAALPLVYTLNGGQPTNQAIFTQLAPGIYTIEVQDANGCGASVEATVQAADPVVITLETETLLALGHSYQIDAQVNLLPGDIESIQWTPSKGLSCDTCLNPVATPLDNIRYQLLITTRSGCEAQATLLVRVNKNPSIYVPNVFSPNDDGRNDLFQISVDPLSVRKIKSFQVFSRWGESVYATSNLDPNDLSQGWDGRYRGRRLDPAVFIWYVVVEFVDGREELFKGDVTLKR